MNRGVTLSEPKLNKCDNWKGVLLAGGTGSRLHPCTISTNKHLLPVFDKPMIYYPLANLMLAEIRDIILVSDPVFSGQFQNLLGSGEQWGLSITYVTQKKPRGIADGILAAQSHISDCNVMLALGDNIFYGSNLGSLLVEIKSKNVGATVLGYPVKNPKEYGVLTIDDEGNVTDLEEKPLKPKSNLAVPGLYFYDTDLLSVIKKIEPSKRGELEITDVNKEYLNSKKLSVSLPGRGFAWLDGGTPEDLFEAAQFVRVMEERTGLKLACPEEISWRLGSIDNDQFNRLITTLPLGSYRSYLNQLLEDHKNHTH